MDNKDIETKEVLINGEKKIIVTKAPIEDNSTDDLFTDTKDYTNELSNMFGEENGTDDKN
jgi:hypothetical protein